MIDGYHELHKPGAGSGPGTTALFVSAGVRGDDVINELGFQSLKTISNGDVILIEMGKETGLKISSGKGMVFRYPLLSLKFD